MRGLYGKVALVTGGSSGLGEAIVYRLAEEGVSVAVGGRDEERGASRRRRGGGALARGTATSATRRWCSATSPSSPTATASSPRRSRGSAASTSSSTRPASGSRSPILDTSEAEWDWCVGICLKGTYFMCQAALRHMVPRHARRHRQLASDSGIHGEPGAAVYSAAKAGVVMMTRALAIDHGPDGIRVCSVSPAIFDTPMLANAIAAAPDPVAYTEGMEDELPAQADRPARGARRRRRLPGERRGSFVTGRTLVVDGGVTA